MYEISFNFNAPSNATGKFIPLPKYKKLFAFHVLSATFFISLEILRIDETSWSICLNALISFFPFCLETPFLRPSFKANIIKMVNCAVKAFVEATPISGPVCVKIPASVSLEMVLPTTLQIPSVRAPSSFAFLIAANVSAVSPD